MKTKNSRNQFMKDLRKLLDEYHAGYLHSDFDAPAPDNTKVITKINIEIISSNNKIQFMPVDWIDIMKGN